MKFSCEKALLLQAINVTSRCVAVKSSIPALEGILLTADEGLTLTGYNLETGIQAKVPAEIEREGMLVLPAKLLGDIVRRLPDDVVVFSSDHFVVHIQCGISEYNINAIDPQEFPALPTVDFVNSLTMEQGKLKSMINQVSFAISTENSRPVLTGALFEISADNRLTMVAVDGYRLALRRESGLNRSGVPNFSFLVPGAALSETEKICADSEAPITFCQGERHIQFQVDGFTLICRRLEGEFLNYHTSIPKENAICLLANRRTLMASADRVALIITEKQKNPLRCTFGEDVLTIQTSTALGNAYDACPVSGDGKNLEIGFNHKYLMDALKAAPADEVRLEMNTPTSPCIITPPDGGDQFLYMVLPVRLRAGV